MHVRGAELFELLLGAGTVHRARRPLPSPGRPWRVHDRCHQGRLQGERDWSAIRSKSTEPTIL